MLTTTAIMDDASSRAAAARAYREVGAALALLALCLTVAGCSTARPAKPQRPPMMTQYVCGDPQGCREPSKAALGRNLQPDTPGFHYKCWVDPVTWPNGVAYETYSNCKTALETLGYVAVPGHSRVAAYVCEDARGCRLPWPDTQASWVLGLPLGTIRPNLMTVKSGVYYFCVEHPRPGLLLWNLGYDAGYASCKTLLEEHGYVRVWKKEDDR